MPTAAVHGSASMTLGEALTPPNTSSTTRSEQPMLTAKEQTAFRVTGADFLYRLERANWT